ncbi:MULTISPECIES: alanine racemase [Arthrobacter]|uniref:Alanine racemase n=1 Tax=Arthrobacter caoxuetaonis TaxID=2886935 RepID=A0A9X1MCQ8_9MICC|nr:alanine racemase [Arthrobacter caoxuetaonis]MCC3281147.1 alanine racemase [Arthrobacter caoxuetaonis]MCC3296602.1 alanine racemase [Arthrobacter caoxuetaonis]MCC9192678.1 alanine racemase [Arthrobacter sp. zg-Y916]USQ56570.1 alanine racemase [Arthrobacter caoxuetaonis]
MNYLEAVPPAERSAVVDLAAIRHNVRHLAEIARPARLMAVVKADAYGHGALEVARAALEAGAGWLGVAHISEALALRTGGISAPLLAWLHTADSDFAAAVAANIDIGVSGWELEAVVAAARELEVPARVHLKIDTGLGRNGCPEDLWETFVGRALAYQEDGLLRVVGIFSHLAVADEPHRAETDVQLQKFRDAVAVAEDAGVDHEVRHIANTPAVLSRPDSHFDLVRVGLGMYGLSPFAGQSAAELGLRPAMTLKTTIANCKAVPAGQGVSYGLHYQTPEPTTLALVPLGYADGIPRVATGGPVMVDGEVFPVVGRIAMDQMVIDLGRTGIAGTPASFIGKEAILFGGEGAPQVEEWAQAAGSINYEIITRISGRVTRSYVDTHTGGADAEDTDKSGADAGIAAGSAAVLP